MRAFTDDERQRLIFMHEHRAGARGLERDDLLAIGFALNRRPGEVAVEIARLRTAGLLPFPSGRPPRSASKYRAPLTGLSLLEGHQAVRASSSMP
jgi:hypothetical protein